MEEQRRNEKGERDVQGCDADQRHARGGKERNKGGENTQIQCVCCLCIATEGVSSVKRKGQ